MVPVRLKETPGKEAMEDKVLPMAWNVNVYNLINSNCSFSFCPSSVFYVNLYVAPCETNQFWPWQMMQLEGMACHLLQKHQK
jgi:hypothetical protein